MRVSATSIMLTDGLGLDLTIADEEATVEDLILAMATASDSTCLQKDLRCFPSNDSLGVCLGCTYCCERFNIYLSMIDIIRLAAAEGVPREEFLAFFATYEPWKVDRVRLTDPSRYCLSEDGQGCSKYDVRPLICRLYICCPHTPRAKALIGEVNRLAEEDLVNWRTGRADADNPFHGKFAYGQVCLKDCLAPELWQSLYQPEQSYHPVA